MTVGRQSQAIASLAEMMAQGANKADLSFGSIKGKSLRRAIQRIVADRLKGSQSLDSIKDLPCGYESFGCPE
jgi:hypothetical protein